MKLLKTTVLELPNADSMDGLYIMAVNEDNIGAKVLIPNVIKVAVTNSIKEIEAITTNELEQLLNN